jgi:hypothetical protein
MLHVVAIPTRDSHCESVQRWFETYPPLARYQNHLNEIADIPNGDELLRYRTIDELKDYLDITNKRAAKVLYDQLHGMCGTQRDSALMMMICEVMRRPSTHCIPYQSLSLSLD